MTVAIIVLLSISLLLNIGIIVFLWWQFTTRNSKLLKLIDNEIRLETLPTIEEDDNNDNI